MKFPVDFLADVSQAELEQSAHSYVNNLLYSSPDSPEHLILSDSTQVTIDISSVGFTPLYGSSDKQKVLALFSPRDPFTAVALYLLDQWWAVDDILKTADPARDGALEVETVGERIVLYILNRVIYRAKEMSSEELPFLCHGEKDYAKILWNDGEAVGFYSVKPSGRLCNSFSTRSYQLPVMDSVFVRKCQRGKGFGLQMLEDFVLSFKEDCLGLKYPLTKSMYKVCEKYLCQYPGDTDLLWEVESIGMPNQRANIASKIQAMDLNAVCKSLSFTAESLMITEVTEKDVEREPVTTQIKDTESMECTVEIVEEVTVVRAPKVSEAEEVPVAVLGRGRGSKQMNVTQKTTKDKSEKVIRIEDIEAETPKEQQLTVHGKTALYTVSESAQTEDMFNVTAEEKREAVVDTASEEAAAMMLDKPATVPASQDLEEAGITAPMTEELQVEDVATQDLKTTSRDSQIIVENVASETEEPEEECQKEDTDVSVVAEEVVEVDKEAEALNKVSAEKSDESVTQHELSLSTHRPSEDGDAGKTGKTVVRVIHLVQNETPRQRSQHSKPQDNVMTGTTAWDGGRVLRGRTVMSTPPPKRKHTRHSLKVCEELEKEFNEVVEKDQVSTAEIVEEISVNEREEKEEITPTKENIVTVEELPEEKKQQSDDERLTNEEETEKQEEPGMENSVVKKSSTELPDIAETALSEENKYEKVTDESEKEENDEEVDTSVIQDKREGSDDNIDEPSVVQRRAVRGRQKVSPKPKPRKQGKRHQKQEEPTNEADLRALGSAEEKADEQATESKPMEEHHQEEQEGADDITEEEISTENLTVMTEGAIPQTEEATEDVIPSNEVNVEESKEAQDKEETEKETETVSAMETDQEEEAVGVSGVADDVREPNTVVPASETVIPDEVQDEAVVPVPEEPQEKDTGSEIPKLQKATVILVDLKSTCHHLGMNEAEDKTVAAPEKEQMGLIAAEDKEVSSCVAEKQTSEPEMLIWEEEDGGKQENITEKSVDATPEAETVKKEEFEEDYSEKEKEKSASEDETKSEAGEAPVIETRVLRSGRKIVEASCKSRGRSNQHQEEDTIDVIEKEVDEVEAGTVEVEGEMEAVTKNVLTVIVPVQEEESAALDIDADTEADIPVGDDTEENLPPAEVNEAMSLEEKEEPVVETRGLRSLTKTGTATATTKTPRSGKQVDEQKAENSEDEEVAVRTRTLRQGRISISATPKSKSRRTCKQIREEEQKDEEESKSVEETAVGEQIVVNEAAVEKANEEIEGKIEDIGEKAKEEAAAEREEILESEVDVQEGEALAEEGQNVDQHSEVTLAERDGSGEEYNEQVMEIEEMELPPVAVNRSLRSGGKTSKAPPKPRPRRSKKQEDEEEEEGGASDEQIADGNESPADTSILRRGSKSVSRGSKQLQKTTKLKESAEEAGGEEEEEAELGSAEEPPTEGEEGKAIEVDKVEVDKEELVTVDVQKGVSEEGTMAVTEEEENTAGVTVAADDLVQEGETDPPLAKPDTDSAELTCSEEEAIPATDEQQSKEMTSQVSDLQRVTVVLVDLKKTYHEVQDDTAAVEEGVPVENTAFEEKGQRGQTMKEEETMAEEHVPGSSGEIGRTELEKVVVEEEGLEESVKDVVTTQEDTGESSVEETEAKNVEDEEEPKVTETRKRRSTKHAAKATPKRKSARSGKKMGEEEKEAASEMSKEEPVVKVRVLRRGKKSIPVTQRFTRRNQKQLQEEEGEGGETSTGVEEKEAEEEEEHIEEHQMSDQEKGERTDKKDATQQIEKIEPEMGIEKVDTMTEEVVTQQDDSEEEQTGSTETAADGNTDSPAGQSADERKCSDDFAQEPVTTQDTVEREQSISTSEVAETAAGESAQKTPLTAKDNKEIFVSEEEEDSVIETRILRSGEKAVRTKPQSKNTKRQDEEQDVEAAGKESTDEDEPAVETRVLRKGRRSAHGTPRHESKRHHTQCQPEEDPEEVTTPAEETEGEEAKADENESSSDDKKDDEEAVAQKEENTEPEYEMEIVETVAEESCTEQETVEEEQSAVLQTYANEQGEGGGSGEESANTNKGNVTDVEEAPVVESRVLRSVKKAVKATPRSKTTKSQQQGNEKEGTEVERCADTDEPQETRALRKVRSSAPATPRHKSKRTRTQFQPEKEAEEVTSPAEETEGEEGQETFEQTMEKAEKEGKCMEMEVEKKKDLEEEEVENSAGGDSVVEDARQMKDVLTEGTAVPEKEDNSMGAVDKTRTAEGTNSAEEKDKTGQEADPPAEDIAEKMVEEKADLINNRVLEPAPEEPATEETQSPEEDSSGESQEDKTVDSSVVEGRNLKRIMKTANREQDETEGRGKRPRVDYREDEEGDGGGGTEAAADKENEDEAESDEDEDEDKKKAEYSADEQREKLQESEKEENLEKDMGAVESTSEKGPTHTLVLNTDGEVEAAAVSQEHEEDELNILEEEVEPIVIGKRVLRGRSVPSIIITPRSKPRHRSATVQKAEESDEEKSPQSARKRSLRKNKSTEVTSTHKSERHSRV
ncbi:trichohyalin-like isoform X1 [Lates japonicus]|uniref:Trichohyalin-like isoform X1 n=1 Tax=Lates japonicus TaxID=270547 RepID=A0AAD3NBJ5_LATJO|nr:trichohyalin-like isoform X1 [Lates japonicus]